MGSPVPTRHTPTTSTLDVAVAIGATALLAALIMAALASGLTVGDAVADPEEYTGERFVGIVSTVGVLVWVTIGTICGFTGLVLDATNDEGRQWRRFFYAATGLAAILFVDDFLLIHELADDLALLIVDFDATRGRKNILEAAVFACYGLLALVYWWRFRPQFRQLDHRPLRLAIGLLGLSLLVDMRVHRAFGLRLPDGSDGPDLRSILEEGPKFLGIVYLAVFAGQAGHRVIVSQRRSAQAVPVTQW